ncbi:MAG: hydantoinase B/oxoprolinase family protein [Candidatus Rokubacteria bacterium]|nr:hydantoinase B/oxoprolinase family protein [Candidatus Rokubacteria bacterium]
MKRSASDPVFVEVAWSRLISVVEQEAQALLRTAFTNIVRESGDLSAGVFDLQGRMVAQAVTGTPGHINSMALAVPHVLRAIDPATLVPGDVLATNDPWLNSGHLNDITVVTPVFHRGRLVGYTASTCHAMDIGGRGITVDALDCYEEGMLLPPCRLYAAGAPQQVLDLLAANVRAPEAVLGDLHAQVSGNAVGAHRLVEMLEEFDLDDIEALSEAILDRSEAGMRAAIAEIPDGAYRGTLKLDGFEEPIVIQTCVTVRGGELTVDYAGSSPASKRAVNVVLNYTKAYTTYGVKCVVAPHVPNNAGSFRPVTITAPEGSLLNAVKPAPVASRHLIGLFLPDAVMGALVHAVPDRVIAESSSILWTLDVRGRATDGHTFKEFIATGGGMGARPTKDGLNATQFPSTIRGVPAEVVESVSPLVIYTRALAPDSGGAGRWRGGLGMLIEFGMETHEDWLFTASFERAHIPCQGRAGGGPGAPGKVMTADGRTLSAKAQHWMKPHERVLIQTPGGGGFGDPRDRDPKDVAADVAAGRVTRESAARVYGVEP